MRALAFVLMAMTVAGQHKKQPIGGRPSQTFDQNISGTVVLNDNGGCLYGFQLEADRCVVHIQFLTPKDIFCTPLREDGDAMKMECSYKPPPPTTPKPTPEAH